MFFEKDFKCLYFFILKMNNFYLVRLRRLNILLTKIYRRDGITRLGLIVKDFPEYHPQNQAKEKSLIVRCKFFAF